LKSALVLFSGVVKPPIEASRLVYYMSDYAESMIYIVYISASSVLWSNCLVGVMTPVMTRCIFYCSAFADLQMELTDLTNDLREVGFPFQDYKTYTFKLLFQDNHPIIYRDRSLVSYPCSVFFSLVEILR